MPTQDDASASDRISGTHALHGLIERLRVDPAARRISMGTGLRRLVPAGKRIDRPCRRDGYTAYEEAAVIKSGGYDWMLAFGKYHGEPQEPFPLLEITVVPLRIEPDTSDDILIAYASEVTVGVLTAQRMMVLLAALPGGEITTYRKHPQNERFQRLVTEIDAEARFRPQAVEYTGGYKPSVVETLHTALTRLMAETP